MKATEEMCKMTLQEEKELMLYLEARHRIYLTRRHYLNGKHETVGELHRRIAPHLLDAEAIRLVRIKLAVTA
jgi:hypothetical protein